MNKKTFLCISICTILLRQAVNLNGCFVTGTETGFFFYNVTFHKGTSNLHKSLNKLNGTRAVTATDSTSTWAHSTHFYKNNNNPKVNIITTRQSDCRRVFLQSNVPHLYQRLEGDV